ncbi:MAG TPA: TetR-like C-terminal domain-containing protein [Galbitalea sp.]|jgi:AcrR family transcriptional regulator|nr:TetR-like C-terminal domain-containing protein [Galbitalea sp.]
MPRAGLSETRVVEEAEHLTDEGAPLTLVELARRLGVQVPSLYKHVAGADALNRLVSVRAKNELADILARATVGKARDEAVGAVAVAYRDWAMQHPGRYAMTLRAPEPDDDEDQDASGRAVQVVFDALAGYGLSGDDAIDATRFVRSTLHGFIAIDAAGGFALPALDRSFLTIVAALRLALGNWASLTI